LEQLYLDEQLARDGLQLFTALVTLAINADIDYVLKVLIPEKSSQPIWAGRYWNWHESRSMSDHVGIQARTVQQEVVA
jgi:hypothetical protein